MDSPKIYVASLSDYNAGRLEGEWFDFNDFSDGEDLMDGITTMLGEIQDKYNDDELREEWAVHDYEGFPSSLYSEYMGEKDFQQIFDIKEASEDVNIPYEVLLERVADTGDEDYQNIADSLFLRVDGYDETDIIYDYEDQIGNLPMSFWQNYLYVDDVTLRTIEYEEESRIKEELMDDGMSEEEAEEQAEEQASDERQRIEDDLEGYLEETGYIDGDGNVTIPNWVSKDYKRAWNQGLSYDFDVIHHNDEMFVFSNNYAKGGNISKEYSFGGGVAVGGIVGAYLGYKVGRMRPQKAGFETEKKIGRRIKKEGKKIAGDMTISKKKPQTMAKGGWLIGGKKAFVFADGSKFIVELTKDKQGKQLPILLNITQQDSTISILKDEKSLAQKTLEKAKEKNIEFKTLLIKLKNGGVFKKFYDTDGTYAKGGKLKSLSEIKEAVRQGKNVHWSNDNYKVFYDNKLDEFYVLSQSNNNMVGLTSKSGKLTHNINDFYVKEKDGFNEVYGRFKDDIRKSFGGDKFAEGGEILVVKTKKGLKTMKDFEDFSKDEIKEWGTERGWKYNAKGEKFGGQALKIDEFFVKPRSRYNVQLPSSSYAEGGGVKKLNYSPIKETEDYYEMDSYVKGFYRDERDLFLESEEVDGIYPINVNGERQMNKDEGYVVKKGKKYVFMTPTYADGGEIKQRRKRKGDIGSRDKKIKVDTISGDRHFRVIYYNKDGDFLKEKNMSIEGGIESIDYLVKEGTPYLNRTSNNQIKYDFYYEDDNYSMSNRNMSFLEVEYWLEKGGNISYDLSDVI